jgi:5-methylcytosine-specific restriction enzyme subunit McrC
MLDDAVGEALAASEVVSAYRLAPGEWEVAATSKIGVASIAHVTIWIAPKVDIRRIMFLLGYARDPGWRDELVALGESRDLVSALAHAFVTQAERAVEQGLLQGYTEVDDSLAVLRGRMREHDQLRQRFGIPVPLRSFAYLWLRRVFEYDCAGYVRFSPTSARRFAGLRCLPGHQHD